MRGWTESDRDSFAAMNADPEVMAFLLTSRSFAARCASLDPCPTSPEMT